MEEGGQGTVAPGYEGAAYQVAGVSTDLDSLRPFPSLEDLLYCLTPTNRLIASKAESFLSWGACGPGACQALGEASDTSPSLPPLLSAFRPSRVVTRCG